MKTNFAVPYTFAFCFLFPMATMMVAGNPVTTANHDDDRDDLIQDLMNKFEAISADNQARFEAISAENRRLTAKVAKLETTINNNKPATMMNKGEDFIASIRGARNLLGRSLSYENQTDAAAEEEASLLGLFYLLKHALEELLDIDDIWDHIDSIESDITNIQGRLGDIEKCVSFGTDAGQDTCFLGDQSWTPGGGYAIPRVYMRTTTGDIYMDCGNNCNLRAPGRSGVNGRLTGYFSRGYEIFQGVQGSPPYGSAIESYQNGDLLLRANRNFNTGGFNTCNSCTFNSFPIS